MSDSSQQFLPNCAKLRGSENYAHWKAQMKVTLESKELQDFILPSSKAQGAEKGFTELERVWRTNNAKAKLAIMVHVRSEPADLISDLDTAAEMWETLRRKYEGQGHNLKHSYFNEIISIRYEHFNSVTAFIVRFKNLVSCLAQVKIKLPDDVYIILFINALDDAFPIWTARQRSNARSHNTNTLSDLFVDITDEARRTGASRDSRVAVHTGGTEKGKGRKGNSRRNNNQKDDTRKQKQCTHCKKKGHKEADCWIAPPEKNPGAPGKDEKTGFSLYSMSALARYRNNWLIGTGASEHMCHDHRIFSTLTEPPSLKSIETASGTIKPRGIGSVKLTVWKTSGERVALELKNVLYVPNLPVNLFSGSSITKHENSSLALHAINQPTIETWDRRPGHLGYDNVLKTALQTTGIELGDVEMQKPGTVLRGSAKPVNVDRPHGLRVERREKVEKAKSEEAVVGRREQLNVGELRVLVSPLVKLIKYKWVRRATKGPMFSQLFSTSMESEVSCPLLNLGAAKGGGRLARETKRGNLNLNLG